MGIQYLEPSFATNYQGCYDLAENNARRRPGPRLMHFRGVDDAHVDNLISQSLFGDGASAVVVGATVEPARGSTTAAETQLFHVVHATQLLILETGGAIRGGTREAGLIFSIASEVPSLIASSVEAGRPP
ncbi:hypothetical protein EJB05_26998, partial [Eragrostis curvula]